nr:helix-turn-helix domain-containing protein [Pseudomonas monteilii]
MTACWPLEMSAAQKSVLISLADNANDDGVCWPSIARICERTCLKERAVRNAIRWLESVGLLVAKERAGRSTYYVVTPASYAPGIKCPPAPDAPRTVIEPKGEPSKNRKKGSDGFTVEQMLELAPPDLSEQTARDYFQFRKKKGPLNLTIWNNVLAELEGCRAAGISPDKALAEAMTAAWQGFKTSWIVDRLKKEAWASGTRGAGQSHHTDLDKIDHTEGLVRQPNGTYRVARS